MARRSALTGSRIAIAGNSVGGQHGGGTRTHDQGPGVVPPLPSRRCSSQRPTPASIPSPYHDYGTERFLGRDFMKYGWDLYAPDAKTRDNPYVSPLRASLDQLKGLPPALVITAGERSDCATRARPMPAS